MSQLWVVYNPRLYSDCRGPTSIPYTVTIFRRLSHCLPPNIFTWHTGNIIEVFAFQSSSKYWQQDQYQNSNGITSSYDQWFDFWKCIEMSIPPVFMDLSSAVTFATEALGIDFRENWTPHLNFVWAGAETAIEVSWSVGDDGGTYTPDT